MNEQESFTEQGELSPEVQVQQALEMLNGPVLDAMVGRIPEPMLRDLVALSYAATLRAAQSVGLDPMEILVWGLQPPTQRKAATSE
jgi:hypothetical protein